jgi:hypothetical protein
VTVIYLIIAIALLAGRDSTNWYALLGGALFYAGLVNFLLRSAYLARAAEDENEELKEELARERDSLALGKSIAAPSLGLE